MNKKKIDSTYKHCYYYTFLVHCYYFCSKYFIFAVFLHTLCGVFVVSGRKLPPWIDYNYKNGKHRLYLLSQNVWP